MCGQARAWTGSGLAPRAPGADPFWMDAGADMVEGLDPLSLRYDLIHFFNLSMGTVGRRGDRDRDEGG